MNPRKKRAGDVITLVTSMVTVISLPEKLFRKSCVSKFMTPSVDSICRGAWPVQDSISHHARKLNKWKELTHSSDISLVTNAFILT